MQSQEAQEDDDDEMKKNLCIPYESKAQTSGGSITILWAGACVG